MTKNAFRIISLLSSALALALFSPQRAAADDDDPPSRVARLSYVHGEVSFEPAGTDEWVTVGVNRPLTTGDKLWTDRGARAELHMGSAVMRLSGETGFSFLNLDDRVTQIRLAEGTISVRVRELDQDETFEIDTPNLAFTVLRPGTYRVEVNEAGDSTLISVRRGDGEVAGAGTASAVHAGQTVTFFGRDQISADVQSLDRDDDFDRWCADRDDRAERSISAHYVSTDVIGYEDLDDYGGWRPVPEYGTVWFPHTTIVGWAPYRYGHWVWISPWGWTWVDDAPWGFAPFHYGRWVFVGRAWGWVPCAPRPRVLTVAYVRPVYAPALVAWIGGAHWGVGVSAGHVGWFPLGPREVFIPSYHVSPRYVTNVNVTNTTINNTQVTNVYNNYNINRNVNHVSYVNRGAVTATSQGTFTSARPVGRDLVRVDRKEIAAAQVGPEGPPVGPDRRSVLGAGGNARVRPPATLQERPVVAKTAPPPAPPAFSKQEEAIKANGGRPLPFTRERQIEMQNGDARRSVRIAQPPQTEMPQKNASNQPGRPSGDPPAQPSRPNPRIRDDRPPSPSAQPRSDIRVQPRPIEERMNHRDAIRPPENAKLRQRQRVEHEKLQRQQDQQRQKLEQRQQQEERKLEQRNADDRRRQEAQQKQQQQLERQEQKHQEQQQKMQQRQQQERQKQQEKEKDKPRESKPHPDRPSAR